MTILDTCVVIDRIKSRNPIDGNITVVALARYLRYLRIAHTSASIAE